MITQQMVINPEISMMAEDLRILTEVKNYRPRIK